MKETRYVTSVLNTTHVIIGSIDITTTAITMTATIVEKIEVQEEIDTMVIPLDITGIRMKIRIVMRKGTKERENIRKCIEETIMNLIIVEIDMVIEIGILIRTDIIEIDIVIVEIDMDAIMAIHQDMIEIEDMTIPHTRKQALSE